MNKYKLINKQTGETHLCDKVEIDGLDYYVSDEFLRIGDYGYWEDADIISQISDLTAVLPTTKKVIATTNPSIDLPKVMDEVEKYSEEFVSDIVNPMVKKGFKLCFTEGYNKSQETHPFSEEDMVEFNEWQKSLVFSEDSDWLMEKSDKELLQLWKEQKPKIVYYG